MDLYTYDVMQYHGELEFNLTGKGVFMNFFFDFVEETATSKNL